MMPSLSDIAALFTARDREGFAACLSEAYADDPDLSHLADLVACAFDLALPPLTLVDQVFAAALAATVNILRAGGTVPFGTASRFVGRGADRLGHPPDEARWTLVQCVNWLLLRQIRPRRRAAVVATMRDEGFLVLEWVAHHLSLGFEGIFIYTNDNADGSDALFAALAARGVIVHVRNQVSVGISPQIKAYEHALHLQPALRDFEWVLFADADELLMPDSRSIGAVLDHAAARYPERLPSAICFAWLWFFSGNAYARRPGLMLESFQHAGPHDLRKSLTHLRDVVSMRWIHIPEHLEGGFYVDGGMEPITRDRVWRVGPDQYRGGCINHYWNRSFEEFSVKKARGDTLMLRDGSFQRAFANFFAQNKNPTAEDAHPTDPLWLERVRRTIALLRSMPGVPEAEKQIEDAFPALLARWDAQGGLRRIYEAHHVPEPTPEPPPILVLQTTDPFVYHPLYEIAARPTRRYCERHGLSYVGYIGIKSGRNAVDATFNRILLLHEMLTEGYRGWVLYLDADAYIYDLSFHIRDFLAGPDIRPIMGARGGDQAWNVNAGILLMDYGNEAVRKVIQAWFDRYHATQGQDRDDQALLHHVLAQEDASQLLGVLPFDLIGHEESRWIRHLLRHFGDFEKRLKRARADVERIMA